MEKKVMDNREENNIRLVKRREKTETSKIPQKEKI